MGALRTAMTQLEPEEQLIVRRQQVVAPRDRLAQRAEPAGMVACPSGQHRHSRVQPLEEVVRLQVGVPVRGRAHARALKGCGKPSFYPRKEVADRDNLMGFLRRKPNATRRQVLRQMPKREPGYWNALLEFFHQINR